MPLINSVSVDKLDFTIVTVSEYETLETNDEIDEDTVYLVVAD